MADLSTKMNVSRQTIYNWEDGITEPKLSQFITLYVLVGMNPANMLPTVKKQSVKEEHEHISKLAPKLPP